LKRGSRPNKSDCVNAKGLKPTGREYELLLYSPHSEEVAVVLRKAGWQCEVRAGDKDPGVHAKAGVSGGEKPFMTYQPEKQNNTVLVNVATKAFAAPVGSFALDKITEDFVQTEATKFFARAASEIR
jgi:signal recognition particle subunit SEC65